MKAIIIGVIVLAVMVYTFIALRRQKRNAEERERQKKEASKTGSKVSEGQKNKNLFKGGDDEKNR